jgi:hypothetical protein
MESAATCSATRSLSRAVFLVNVIGLWSAIELKAKEQENNNQNRGADQNIHHGFSG